ncbi:ras and EF-hand domain-containing protein-like isoform X2 [Carassius auratus]|uniref:Ras and EF-hand domain-containing protein-like isoform X2 n=1 Tax=Carassius auratus TaxID=7957 RepID=A0A6P6LQ88_CARAU|nr:ras and EF-hand domain-containing protein-like isoform X2 [Carassius auratus]
MNHSDLRRLFAVYDGNKLGRVKYEDFTSVCQELNVPADEIRTLFNKFDLDGDGYINFSDFSSSFQEVSEALNLTSLGNSLQIHRSGWEEFENKLDGDVAFYLGRQRDELKELYEQIHSTSGELVLQQYEDLIKALVAESKEHRMESEQLETSLRRTEELASSQLAEMEEDLQQQLAHTEERVREEERKKLDESIAMLQIKHENELADLHTTIERLTKYQEELKLNRPREDDLKLRAQIRDLMQENEELRSSLMKAQINVSILKLELDRLKNAFTEQKLQHKSDDLKKMVMEYQSYSNQIESLQEINKTLYVSNDGLCSALSQDNASMKRLLSPKNEVPSRMIKPLRQSTMNQSGFTEEDTMALVKFWADKYLDSGVSIQTDTEPMSGSNYDSDDSHNSVETMHHTSYSIPSDLKVSEEKSEALGTVARSTAGSISSFRRRLSAFPVKQIEEDLHDTEDLAPAYRLVLAGDAGSGKSSFLLRLSLNEFRGDIQSTLGVDFQIKKMLVDGEKTNLQIWDTAGQERFRSIARSYFRKAHGVLLLYDVTSESSFLNVREWVEQIWESTNEDIPMCIIGNKVDLREERPEGSCVSAFHGEKLAMAYNALFCEASAKEGTNVIEAVLHLARKVKKTAKLGRRSGSQVKLSCLKRKTKPSNCCGV